MEINEEKTSIKAKKIPIWILIGYIICIIAIIVSSIIMRYRQKLGAPTFVDFTTVQSIENLQEQYGALEVEGLTEEIIIDGDLKDKASFEKNRYYIALNEGYMYIVNLDSDTIDSLKTIKEYTYSQGENVTKPDVVKIYGKIETIPTEIRTAVLDFYNKSVGEQYVIEIEDFEMYFGNILLNARNTSPVNNIVEKIIIIVAVILLIIISMANIAIMVIGRKTGKHLKNND